MSAPQPAPLPADEGQRIQSLFDTNALTVPDERLRPIAEFACEAFEVPMAHMSLVDTETQWFRAAVGLQAQSCARADSFCSHVVAKGETMVVPDAWADPTFAENPFVTGEPYLRFYAGVPLRSREGHSLGTLCVLDTRPRPFTEPQQRQLAQLATLAADVVTTGAEDAGASDRATGLSSEAAIRDRAATAMGDAGASDRSAAVVCIDIERFRETLLARGAAYAGKLLAEVGCRLVGAFGEEASVGRFGADGFLAVTLLADEAVDVAAFAEPVRAAFDEPFVIDGETAVLTARIGIGLFPRDGTDAASLIDCADQALQTRRPVGTTTVNAYDPAMAQRLHRDLTVERRLRLALSGETTAAPAMVYQPKVGVADGRVVGAEALMRWHDDELGRVSPGEFIPVAESSGLIHPLGRQSLAEACHAAAAWPVEGGEAPTYGGRQCRRRPADQPQLYRRGGGNPACHRAAAGAFDPGGHRNRPDRGYRARAPRDG